MLTSSVSSAGLPDRKTEGDGLATGLLDVISECWGDVTATRFKPLDRSYGGVPAGCEPAPRGCVGETIE